MTTQATSVSDAVAIYRLLDRESLVAIFARLETNVIDRLLKIAAQTPECSDSQLSAATERFAAAFDSCLDKPEVVGVGQGSEPSIDSVLNLSDAEIKRLLSKVNTGCWAPALKHATADTRNRIFSNMASPVAAILRKEIGQFVRFSNEEIQAANGKIQNAVEAILDKRPPEALGCNHAIAS